MVQFGPVGVGALNLGGNATILLVVFTYFDRWQGED